MPCKRLRSRLQYLKALGTKKTFSTKTIAGHFADDPLHGRGGHPGGQEGHLIKGAMKYLDFVFLILPITLRNPGLCALLRLLALPQEQIRRGIPPHVSSQKSNEIFCIISYLEIPCMQSCAEVGGRGRLRPSAPGQDPRHGGQAGEVSVLQASKCHVCQTHFVFPPPPVSPNEGCSGGSSPSSSPGTRSTGGLLVFFSWRLSGGPKLFFERKCCNVRR